MMMWLPEQQVEQWLSSVDALIALGPEHASLYLLELYPNAPLKEDMARAGWSLAPDDDAATMYLVELGRKHTAAIAAHLNDPNARVREQIAIALGLIGGAEARAALSAAAADGAPEVRRAVEPATAASRSPVRRRRRSRTERRRRSSSMARTPRKWSRRGAWSGRGASTPRS